jgi:hypothetical protein
MHPSRMQLCLLRLARSIGMLQYSLDHISEKHTVEKTFKLADEAT